MSNEKNFIDGPQFKALHERAPEYVKANGSIKVAELPKIIRSRADTGAAHHGEAWAQGVRFAANQIEDALARQEADKTAAPVGQEIAYLDLGVGGYIDLGSAMTDEQLAKLPKGRHALGIIGTYGVDGYVAAPPAAQAVDLPDDLSESKDWRESDYNGRIEWLKAMHASQRAEIARLQNDVEMLRALIDQQAGKGVSDGI